MGAPGSGEEGLLGAAAGSTPFSRSEGSSDAAALGQVNERKQAIKSATMNVFANGWINLNILHLCCIGFGYQGLILAQGLNMNREENQVFLAGGRIISARPDELVFRPALGNTAA